MEPMFDFGEALRLLKEGKRVCRQGWNGKKMFIFRMPGYPDGIPANAATAKAMGIEEGSIIKVLPYLTMKTADGSLCTGWLASQTDMLSEDWMLAE